MASDIFYCGQFRVNEPPISSTTGNSITGAVQQDLVPPFRVTPPPFIADKLSRKLCFHPDQRKVDFVISGITIGFLLSFDPSAVLLWFATQNMPSASFYPSVIDQCILTELEKGRVAGPCSISRIPSLQSLWGGPKEISTWKVAGYLRFI